MRQTLRSIQVLALLLTATTLRAQTIDDQKLQPASLALDTASQYDWTGRQWTVPVEASLSQVLHLGGHDIEIGLTGRYFTERPSDGPRWGLGFTVTFLFPKLPIKP